MSNVSNTHDFGETVDVFPVDRRLTDWLTSLGRDLSQRRLQIIATEILKSLDRTIRGEKNGRRSPTKTFKIPRTMIDIRRRVTEKQLKLMRRGRELK